MSKVYGHSKIAGFSNQHLHWMMCVYKRAATQCTVRVGRNKKQEAFTQSKRSVITLSRHFICWRTWRQGFADYSYSGIFSLQECQNRNLLLKEDHVNLDNLQFSIHSSAIRWCNAQERECEKLSALPTVFNVVCFWEEMATQKMLQECDSFCATFKAKE